MPVAATPPSGSRVVLVTGCSSGLGMETAAYLAARGFHVCATMRDPAGRARLDAAHARHGGTGALEVLRLDVTDEPSIQEVVHDIAARHGGLFGLVNNAGVILRGFFEDLDDAEIRRVFETNVFGTMAVTRAALPHLRRAGTGRIVIVGSIGGRLGSPAVSAYCASKFALEGFGEALVQEVEPLGIHVALVAPAMIQTDVWGPNRGVARRGRNPDSPYYALFQREEQWADEWMRSSPTQPEDVARVVHHALTADRPRFRYIVGKRAARTLALRQLLPGELFERIYARLITRHLTRGADVTGAAR